VQFVQHRRIETFMEETLLHLEKDEAINNLMLGIALRLQQDASLCPDAVCFTIRDEDGLALAALMTPPEKLIVYSPREVSAEPLRCLIQGVLDNNVSISGVIGPAKLARLFADLWAHQTGSPVKLEMHMRVYELREVNREVIGEGRLRTAEEKDLEFVIEAVAQFQRDAGFGEPDPETCAAMARSRNLRRNGKTNDRQSSSVFVGAPRRDCFYGCRRQEDPQRHRRQPSIHPEGTAAPRLRHKLRSRTQPASVGFRI